MSEHNNKIFCDGKGCAFVDLRAATMPPVGGSNIPPVPPVPPAGGPGVPPVPPAPPAGGPGVPAAPLAPPAGGPGVSTVPPAVPAFPSVELLHWGSRLYWVFGGDYTRGWNGKEWEILG